MIKKLKQVYKKDSSDIEYVIPPSLKEMIDKINEIIQWIQEQQK